jgi:hypothetical protein
VSAAYYPLPARAARRVWLVEVLGSVGVAGVLWLVGRLLEADR